MARFVYGMNVSLDGYVDHDRFAPDPPLFRHWIAHVRGLSGSVYGRRIYEVMRYWDEDRPDWSPEEREFAEAWRAQPKWVASRTLRAVGPNATLLPGEVEGALRALKERVEGEVAVSGTVLAQAVADWGLIDEVRLYLNPVVLGRGTPFFAGPRPRLRLLGSERIGEEVVRIAYAPA